MNTFIVLGTSRSGSSLVTSLLQACGVYLGEDLRSPGRHNPRGYFEHIEVRKIDKRLLSEAGYISGRDFTNPSFGDSESANLIAKGYINKIRRQITKHLMRKFIENNKRDSWGFKANGMTFRLWKKMIPNPKIIFVYREPYSVARSWMKASSETLSFNRQLKEWLNANMELLYDVETCESMVVEYEDLFNNKNSVKEIVKFVGSGDESKLEKIIDPKLNNSKWSKKMEYPAEIQSLLNVLASYKKY